MNVNNYFKLEDNMLSFTRNQASLFAKRVAGDFNSIHDEDARRFCVPGDLLFAVFLSQYGLYQQMKFEFSGMVADSTQLIVADITSDNLSLKDSNDKNYMDISFSGEKTINSKFIALLSEKYVQFSSQTFPHILVPLMEQENVMINPARPLVIYKSMEIHLDKLTATDISLQLNKARLTAHGKKGEVRLEFAILSEDRQIGHGAKNLLLSGLREFDRSQLDTVIDTYTQRKNKFIAN